MVSDENIRTARALSDRGEFKQALAFLVDDGASTGGLTVLRRAQTLARMAGSGALEVDASERETLWSSCVEAFHLAIERAGDDTVRAEAYLGLAASHAWHGQPSSALEFAKRGAALAPTDPLGRHLVGGLGARGAETPLHGEVMSLFDDYAGFYDHHLVEVLQYGGPRLIGSAVVKHGGQDMDLVVDLGCGTGLCGPGVRMFCETLVGIDLSAEMVARCAKVEAYNAVWQDDAVHALRVFEARSIDAVIAADVVGYIRDLDALIYEISRVLTPNGIFTFSVEAWHGAGDVNLGPSRRLAFAPDYVSRVATEAGMTVLALDEVTIRHEAGVPVGGILVTLAPR